MTVTAPALEPVAGPPWLIPRAAYVHVPFCAHHCGYCDFAVVAGRDHLADAYLDALAAELSRLGRPRPVETIFLGGGTPTHLSPAQLERLLGLLGEWLPLEGCPEFTVEANPGTLDADKVAVLAGHGVNRLSLGAQSFAPDLLRFLERDHDASQIAHAVALARGAGTQASLDLIFGVPGQTPDGWQRDLETALALAPDHVSTYGLTYEMGTPLWKRRRSGEVIAAGEVDELAMYARAIDVLGAAGFEHYEISNHARPGRRCRHNEVYWANESYLGFGLGAARYVGGRREVNTRDIRTYIRRSLAGESPVAQAEELPPEDRARETLAVQLRRAEGIDRARFRVQTGFDLDALAGEAVARHVALGLLEDTGASVRLTRQGKYVADTVIRNLL